MGRLEARLMTLSMGFEGLGGGRAVETVFLGIRAQLRER